MVLSVGTVVAGYRIEGVLGAGGMGTVYRAAHPTLPRSDALKVLSAELSQDDQFRARFTREAELAATLDHPNIVTVYNRGETEQRQLWIAMQYVPGSDADKELREGRMTPERCVHIVREVGKALDYAHRRKLLHRDIKPANFLIAPDDEERVFLADFGIARALDEAVNLTQTGMVMASVAYAAPESLSGEEVDHRADIYSLTCSLYRMLTSKTPYAGTSGGMAGMAAAHVTQPAPRVTDRVPTLPPAIDEVIAIGMAKDPRDRFQTARDLAVAAAEALDETTAEVRRSPVRQPPPGPRTGHTPPTGFPPTGPRPMTTGPVGRDTGPHGGGGWYSGPQHMQPQTGPAPYASGAPPQHFSGSQIQPSAPAKRSRRKLVVGGAIAAVVVLVAAISGFFLTREGEPEYTPQSFTHAHGTTDVTSAPKSVAALGPGDGDAVLALGVQPVALTAPGGSMPSWEQSAVTGSPTVLGFLDTTAVANAKPDLIIATGDIDDATYNKLSAIAPTVTRPSDAAATWSWQDQLKWVGRVLGRDSKATEIISALRTQQDDLRNQNPAFSGKSIEAVWVTDEGVSEVLTPSYVANYLEGIGFRYNADLGREPGDTGALRPVANMTKIILIETDVLIVIRTDKAAAGGGYGGLPSEFNSYKGDAIIADDPNVVAALTEPGGYLATQFLDANFVGAIARQVS